MNATLEVRCIEVRQRDARHLGTPFPTFLFCHQTLGTVEVTAVGL